VTEKTAISYIAKAVMIMTTDQIKEFFKDFSAKDKLYFVERANKKAVRKLLEAHELK
jgi:hypothetical protein